MALVPMRTLLQHARENKYAVGYFESWNMESILSVIDAAEQTNSPIIIGFSGMFLDNEARTLDENIYHYGALGLEIARQSKVPVAFLLNEADLVPTLIKGLKAGFNAIMYTQEGASLEHLIEVNKYLTKTAHAVGADVEAELGELPSSDISTNQLSAGSKTDPEEAAYFVKETNIDALAISVGNVHLLEGKKAAIDFDLVKTLREKLDVPLVLHGGTGVSDEDLKKIISMGISKLNVGTVLKRIFINTCREYLATENVDKIDPHEVIGKGGPQDMLIQARKNMTAEVVRFIKVCGSENMADLIEV